VSAADVDHAAPSKEPPDAARHFPRFIQLFARQASRVADGPRHAVEQRVGAKATEVAIGQTAVGRS